MEGKEFDFKGLGMNGFLMLFINVLMLAAGVFLVAAFAEQGAPFAVGSGVLLIFLSILATKGYLSLEPNEALIMIFFGRYDGTFRKTGFYWVNPFLSRKKVSLRARNLDVEPIKVNDKVGNPVLIGLVLVWRLKNTYKAMFDIDAQTMAAGANATVNSRMIAFEKFVRVQSDAALREVAGKYAYDETEHEVDELTLRGGGDEVNEQLEQKLNERLAMAGMEVIEARLNYLAYAPEIAAVMLRRQQASAIISAREKIVEGAVSMVKMALDRLSADDIVELDEDKKAAMVSNLLVVLCADEAAQPVLNTGTLNH